jgi:hypothetical protein
LPRVSGWTWWWWTRSDSSSPTANESRCGWSVSDLRLPVLHNTSTT